MGVPRRPFCLEPRRLNYELSEHLEGLGVVYRAFEISRVLEWDEGGATRRLDELEEPLEGGGRAVEVESFARSCARP